jgi:hypothetical protein
MAVIVRHEESKQVYVLVGTSYSYYKDSRPSFFGGDLFPHEEEGLFDQVAVADASGKIRWLPTGQVRVIEIDGKKVEDILDGYRSSNSQAEKEEEPGYDTCPGCGAKVGTEEKYCPSCGLTLILEE